MSYTLVRTTPAGQERSQGPVDTTRAAATLAAYVLHDNAGVSKRDAQRFAARLDAAPLGTTIPDAPTGYQFRIEASR